MVTGSTATCRESGKRTEERLGRVRRNEHPEKNFENIRTGRMPDQPRDIIITDIIQYSQQHQRRVCARNNGEVHSEVGRLLQLRSSVTFLTRLSSPRKYSRYIALHRTDIASG